jgi:hypothetical protein
MPDKPTWCGHLDEITEQLSALPDRWVDRATLELILRIGRRRAQQILAPCITRQIGANGLADRRVLLDHLRRLAARKTTVYYERQRRRRLGEHIEALRKSWLEQPRVLVAAPVSVVNSDLAGLPAGVSIAPGQIIVQFATPTEALEKLLALAMAIGNDQHGFEQLVTDTK